MNAITRKYYEIARERQDEHLDGKRSYVSYLHAYDLYQNACAFYGETSIFVHILPPRNLTLYRSSRCGYVTIPA